MSKSETPKKIYAASSTVASSCRLCKSVVDSAHSKNLFGKPNRSLLASAEDIYGSSLQKSELLPHLLCRPCERRLNNFKTFKTLISESQRSLERVKRCIEESPSAPRTTKTSKADYVSAGCVSRSSRRGLNFREQRSLEGGSQFPDTELTLEDSLIDMIQLRCEIERELSEVARRETNSVLRKRGYPGLSSFTFEDILSEMRCVSPTVFTILSWMIQLDLSNGKNAASLALIYGIIMFKRCREMSRLQRLNTVLFSEGNATKELLERFHCYGVTLGATMKYTIQEDIGSHFLDHAVQLVKDGKKFVFVLDNIDWDVKVHDMRSEHQNKSVHAVATSIVFDRVTSDHLPDQGSQKCLENCNLRDLLFLSEEEKQCTKERYKIFLGKIVCEFLPAFEFLKGVVPAKTPCQYEVEMSTASVVVPLPVLMKDEKKYAEVVDVLDQLEAWVREIYSKAGRCAPPYPEHVTPVPAIAAPSRPDQPSSHVPPIPQANDPLANLRVPCFGDQLTRVRLAGAKDLRAGSHTPQDRLDHLYPYRIVDWHTKRSFLKVIFKKLYKNSGREQGTLRYFRENLQRRNVTGDVKHYEDCEQLFLTVGKSFTIEALLHFFGMETKDSRITQNRPPYYILEVEDQKQQYYNAVFDKFIDEFLITGPRSDDVESNPDEEDFVRNYSLCLIRYYFLFCDLKDAIKEGNGQRLASLHKVLLLHFKALQGFNAYAIEMLINTVQNEIFLSEAEAHQCKWASTVNWKGGAGKNMEIDLLQENRNKDIKTMIKRMGANKTDKAIANASRAAGGQRKIVENFDAQVNRASPSTSSHSHKSAATDEGKVQAALHALKPFNAHPHRRHDSFPAISPDPLSTLNEVELDRWLNRHKRNLILDAPMEHHDDDVDDNQ
ncbi:uncharacterized protein [Montipora foliosa]